MVIKSIIGVTCTCLAIVSFTSNAALVSRLGGLAYYDDVADLTWLADANAGGSMNWSDANNWAAGLDVAGVTGWRLPDTMQPDTSCSIQMSGLSYGFSCTGSEMGNLFYNVLGGSAGNSITSNHNANYDLFSNVQSSDYWSATQNATNTSAAWLLNFDGGYQNHNLSKSNSRSGWAVYSGDVSAVPVPAAAWLFGSGLLGLVGVARRKA